MWFQTYIILTINCSKFILELNSITQLKAWTFLQQLITCNMFKMEASSQIKFMNKAADVKQNFDFTFT